MCTTNLLTVALLCVVDWTIRKLNFSSLTYSLSNKYCISLSYFRKFEKINQKVIKIECDVAYLQKCLDLDLIPKFLQLKDPNALLNDHILKSRQIRKINQLIKFHKSKLKAVWSQRSRYIVELQTKLSTVDFLRFYRIITKLNLTFRSKTTERQNKKIKRLWLNNNVTVPLHTVNNLTPFQFSQEQLEVLKTGLRQPYHPSRKDYVNLLVDVEKTLSSSKIKITNQSQNEIKCKLVIYGKRLLNHAKSNAAKHKQMIVKTLRDNADIKILSYDKGNGVAIMKRSEYFDKMQNILNDCSKFQRIIYTPSEYQLDHPTVKAENKMKYYLNRYVKPFVDSRTYKNILPAGSNPGMLYGVAKVHKQNCPLRPIVATFGTPEYNLAKYLNKYINPVICNKYSVNRNSDVINALSQYNFTPNSILVSFDVESLFTNVPLLETIDIAVDKVYSPDNTFIPPFPKETFKQLLHLATTGIFSFNNTLYQQIDGLSMGNPLAPTLANLFVGELESKYLANGLKQATFYTRFVDDSLLIFESDSYKDFHNFLNSWHPNLKFTVEIGGKEIPFLDINVDIKENRLSTSVYRKDTYTSLILNYLANCPDNWKLGLAKTFINRAYVVCNSWINFHKEIVKLKDIFKKNGYPQFYIDQTVKKFLDKQNEKSPQILDTSTINYTACIKIPYFGVQSLYFKKNLRNIMKKLDDKLDISFVFTVPKLKRFFSLKDKVALPLRSSVVYKFQCEVDPRQSYIGKTYRHLGQRVKEHKSKASAIYDHRLNCSCRCSVDQFSIIDTASDNFSLNIKEAIYIKQIQPSLNRTLKDKGSFHNCVVI